MFAGAATVFSNISCYWLVHLLACSLLHLPSMLFASCQIYHLNCKVTSYFKSSSPFLLHCQEAISQLLSTKEILLLMSAAHECATQLLFMQDLRSLVAAPLHLIWKKLYFRMLLDFCKFVLSQVSTSSLAFCHHLTLKLIWVYLFFVYFLFLFGYVPINN